MQLKEGVNAMTLQGEQLNASFKRIEALYWAFAPTYLVHAAVTLRLFDTLEASPLDLAELARRTHASQRGLERVVNGLVGLGLLRRDARGHYALTEDSATFLVSSRPETNWSGAFASLNGEILETWQHVAEAVRSGKPPVAHNRPEVSGDYFAQIVQSILPMSWPASQSLAVHLSQTLRPAQRANSLTALDIASGSGVWSIPLALQLPLLRVAAVDWERVLGVTRRTAERYGVAERFGFIAGDLSEVDFGSGYQFALAGHILHAIGPGRSRALLQKIYASLAPGGTLVVPEYILSEDRSGPPTSVYFAMTMLVASDEGAAFTLSELERWLSDTGFVQVRLLDAPAPSPLLLATKPT
jgi:ubiquinone/menaquinone biosynthesis C-methylase UbiE/AraC-like DNA-binding protein